MFSDRLRLARKRAGLSLRQLEQAIDRKVTAQALNKYEKGLMAPGSEVLMSISKALDLPVSYFISSESTDLGDVEFRTKSSTSSKDHARVKANVLEWVDRYLQLERILNVDSAGWDRPSEEKFPINSVEDAEEVAESVRATWQLGRDAIPNMTELLEEKGLKVLLSDLPQSVSGLTCSVRRLNNPAVDIILANKIHSLERRRLTMAHELGHKIIDGRKLTFKASEQAMNRFASAFLMPRKHLEKELGKRRNSLSYRELMDLKHIYRVSGAALLVRLRDIAVIDQNTLTYAFKTLARNWRTEEPEPIESNDHRGSQEEPRRLRRLCMRALSEKLISLPKASELLREPISSVEFDLKGPVSSYENHN